MLGPLGLAKQDVGIDKGCRDALESRTLCRFLEMCGTGGRIPRELRHAYTGPWALFGSLRCPEYILQVRNGNATSRMKGATGSVIP